MDGTDLVLKFGLGLENARTYKFVIGPDVTSIAGQSLEVRCLTGDVNDSGKVNAADRSVVVSVWTGAGYSTKTDINLSGRTDGYDRSNVVGAWTSVQNCAP